MGEAARPSDEHMSHADTLPDGPLRRCLHPPTMKLPALGATLPSRRRAIQSARADLAEKTPRVGAGVIGHSRGGAGRREMTREEKGEVKVRRVLLS